MQYILSQEEYDNLRNTKTQAIQMARAELQKLCTQIATTMPIFFWGRGTATPWGCPLDKSSRMEYCDECPVQKICPREYKDYSK